MFAVFRLVRWVEIDPKKLAIIIAGMVVMHRDVNKEKIQYSYKEMMVIVLQIFSQREEWIDDINFKGEYSEIVRRGHFWKGKREQ